MFVVASLKYLDNCVAFLSKLIIVLSMEGVVKLYAASERCSHSYPLRIFFFFEKGWGLPLCHPLPSSYAPVKGSVLDETLRVLGIQ